MIQDSSSCAGVPYIYFLIVLVPSSIYIVLIFIKHTYCCGREKFTLYFFFLLQIFYMHQCTNMSINKHLQCFYSTSKALCKTYFFLCLYCLTICIVEYLLYILCKSVMQPILLIQGFLTTFYDILPDDKYSLCNHRQSRFLKAFFKK